MQNVLTILSKNVNNFIDTLPLWLWAGLCYRWVKIPLLKSYVIYVLISYQQMIKWSLIFFVWLKKALQFQACIKTERNIYESVTFSNMGSSISGQKTAITDFTTIDQHARSVIQMSVVLFEIFWKFLFWNFNSIRMHWFVFVACSRRLQKLKRQSMH